MSQTLSAIVEQTRQAAARGLDLDSTRKVVTLQEFEAQFTHGDHQLSDDWDQFVTAAVQRAYLEATGKLSEGEN